MRREGRRPAAAMDRMSCMRRDAYRDVGGRPRLEQAVEGARSRPANAGSHPRHSGERRNPVVYLIHPRPGGDDHPLSGAATLKRQGRIQHPGNPCLDSGFRRNDDETIDAFRHSRSHKLNGALCHHVGFAKVCLIEFCKPSRLVHMMVIS